MTVAALETGDEDLMAHFIGTITGERGPVLRLGSASSGLVTNAASYGGAVETKLYVYEGLDYARVALVPHHGVGTYRVLYDGPVSGGPVVAAGKKIDKATAKILDT